MFFFLLHSFFVLLFGFFFHFNSSEWFIYVWMCSEGTGWREAAMYSHASNVLETCSVRGDMYLYYKVLHTYYNIRREMGIIYASTADNILRSSTGRECGKIVGENNSLQEELRENFGYEFYGREILEERSDRQ